MADSKSAFIQRVISGLLAAVAVFSLGYFGGAAGLRLACTIVVTLGTREFARIAFRQWQMPVYIERLYWAISIAMYVALFLFSSHALEVFALSTVLFFTSTLWLARDWIARQQMTLEQLLVTLAMGCFGLLYCVLFPFYAVQLANMINGGQWFLLLLLVVFFGDTFAYFGGRWLGRHKMFPQISPNKTWEGAAAGLLGSCVAGMVQMTAALPEIPWQQGLIFCLLCGLVSQTGDLIVSLIKRVAQVKDSGHIMPGHGGILDRLDGVFIACPLVYSFALYVNHT